MSQRQLTWLALLFGVERDDPYGDVPPQNQQA